MFKKTFAIAVLAAASAGALVPMAACAQTYTIVRVAPPAPVQEVVPAPRHGYVWTPGYYDYRGNQYTWVQGHYARERPGYAWREARWVETRNGEWRRVGNNWERGPNGDRDHDGIANKYDKRNNNALRPNGDQDGDGVLNKNDRHPYDRSRS
jgi:WXXGXW repeat (2 copies)